MSFLWENTRELHMEVTNKCNALCPQCERVVGGRVNPKLKLSELKLNELKNFFPEDLLTGLEHIYFCGSFGDPMAATEILEILSHFKNKGVNQLSVFTNGSLRSRTDWNSMAGILNRPQDKVVFSIDGLKDTNSIYRVNTDYDRIMDNARTFIAAGGRAVWDYLIFPHNEHQVDEARLLSQEMGFIRFNAKISSRSKRTIPTTLSRENLSEIDLTDPVQAMYAQATEQYGRLSSYFSKTEIQCKASHLRSLYLSHDAKLWPCCWIASVDYSVHNFEKEIQHRQLEDLYGKDFNSLNHHSLTEILNHRWFKNDLAESWTGENRLKVCAQTCGTIIDPVRIQYGADEFKRKYKGALL